MRTWLRNWFGLLLFRLALPCALASSLISSGVRRFRLQMYVHRRREMIAALAGPPVERQPRTRLCVVIANVVGEEEAADPILAAPKVERMRQTVDGLLISFADCELTLLASSLPNRSIVHFLPEYQRARIALIEGPDCDPMFVEFRMQDELIARIDDHDWFLFIEDDIVIHDAAFLPKMQEFHRHVGPRDLLMPHRYEYLDGVKRYIDLSISAVQSWNKVSILKIGGVEFAELTNPHAALYCLSRDQLRLWEQSGRTYRNQVVDVGPLESAATYCLLECFNLFKPHLSNLTYLEVRHWDKKYSQLYPKPESPYTLDPARRPALQVPCEAGPGRTD